MKVFHDTRSKTYRSPFGAVAPGTPVTLAVDVMGDREAKATLRTWSASEGGRVFEMAADSVEAHDGGEGEGTTRFTVTITHERAEVVWYRFDIVNADGVKRYLGAADGCVGGEGVLRDHEPPSFQLNVYEAGDYPPAWHEPIRDYLQGVRESGAALDIVETLATLRENWPAFAFETAMPWPSCPDGETIAPCESGLSCPDPVPADGEIAYFTEGDVLGFWHGNEQGTATCVLINASTEHACTVEVPMVAEAVSELVGGCEVPVVDVASPEGREPAGGAPEGSAQAARVRLEPYAQCILQFHPETSLQKQLAPGVGVLAHVTSLPAPSDAAGADAGESAQGQAGCLGEASRAFVDWAARAGLRYWQVLPVNPTDGFGSPYSGMSALAGNTMLLEGDVEEAAEAAVTADPEGYRAFCGREAAWLEPYACFMAIRDKLGDGRAWQDWPDEYRTFDARLLEDEALAPFAEGHRRAQFAFDVQWRNLRSYANERGVQIVGDMPIYVNDNSADVWANPGIFQLGPDGRPALVAGCPPDAFSPDGQVWGSPLYDWDAVKADGWDWWLRRLERAFDLYDYVRLDHFIGFARYFAIPSGQRASAGSYCQGPGLALFKAAFEKFGPLPVIAEDLGLLMPSVRALIASCGFPGMDIAQFADGGDPAAYYVPRPGKIAYTGTHDNQTIVGFCAGRYSDAEARDKAASIMEKVALCPSDVVIFPLQDVCGLGDEARMNTPGTTENNWIWRATREEVESALETVRNLVDLHGSVTKGA